MGLFVAARAYAAMVYPLVIWDDLTLQQQAECRVVGFAALVICAELNARNFAKQTEGAA